MQWFEAFTMLMFGKHGDHSSWKSCLDYCPLSKCTPGITSTLLLFWELLLRKTYPITMELLTSHLVTARSCNPTTFASADQQLQLSL